MNLIEELKELFENQLMATKEDVLNIVKKHMLTEDDLKEFLYIFHISLKEEQKEKLKALTRSDV